MAPALPRLASQCLLRPRGSHPRKSCVASAVARSSRPAPSPATHCVTQAVLGLIAKAQDSMERTSPPCDCASSQSCTAVKSATSQGSRQSQSAITLLRSKYGLRIRWDASQSGGRLPSRSGDDCSRIDPPNALRFTSVFWTLERFRYWCSRVGQQCRRLKPARLQKYAATRC